MVKPIRPRPPRLPIDSSLLFKLARVVNLTARPFVETLSHTYRLSLNEWRTLVVLASHPGVAARDVAEATGLDKMSVSRALATLERDGRVRRAPNPDDARSTLLHLTGDGQSLFRAVGELAALREAELFRGIGDAEQARMMVTIDKLIAALTRAPPEGEDPPDSEPE